MKSKIIVFSIFTMVILIGCANKEQKERQKFVQDSIKAKKERFIEDNNLGIWKIEYYVDEFGDRTTDGFVSTTIDGTFSNSVTTNSPLRVKMVIDSSLVLINLYEYADSTPVKGEEYMEFSVKDSKGAVYNITTYNDEYGNNTVKSLDGKSEDLIRDILLEGGEIKFSGISNRHRALSKYVFTIKNADNLHKALSRLSTQKAE